MKWYGTAVGPNRKIHSDPTCYSLQTSRIHPVVVLDDADFPFRVNLLCKTCCTGQVSSLHVRCEVCGHRRTRPCPHNGGVLVQGAKGPVWVWPEDALSRTLVHPMHEV